MDVPKVAKKPNRRALLLGAAGVVLAGGATVGFARLRRARPPLSRASVQLERVRRAAFVRDVQARGVLVPEEVQWVTADGPARVARIAVTPGATVEAGAVLVELANAELELASLDAERQAAAARSALAALEARAGVDALASDASVTAAQTDSRLLDARAAAADVLGAEGLAPALDRSEARTRAEDASTRLSIEIEKRAALGRGVGRQIASQRTEVAKIEEVAAFRRRQLAALETRAPVAGVVQELALEPGQWVTAGTVLAKIAKPGRLKAVLQVPEALVADVAAGQPVRLEAAGNRIEGKVARIDPLVQAGVVRVEVALDAGVASGARADLTVTAVIEIERVEAALVMTRPAGVVPNTVTELYRLDEEGVDVVRTRVRLGRGSVREVEVLEGLSEGDTVAIGDRERFGDAEALTLVE